MSGDVPLVTRSATAMDHQQINAASAAALDAEIDAQAAKLDSEPPESSAAPSPMDDVQTSQQVVVATELPPGLQLLQTLEGHTDRVWAVAWSPDGTMLASCSGDKTVRIWCCAPTGTDGDSQWACTSILEEQARTVRALAWSPDGSCLATASFDATTAIWQVQGGLWEVVATLEGHENEVKGVAWASNGTMLATCSRDRSVWIWESMPGHEFECVDVKQGHSQDVKAVRWHPSGELLVSASYDDTIKLWVDAGDEWECVQTLSGPGLGHSSTVWDVAFDAAGSRMVSCSDDTTLKLWGCGGTTSRPQWKLLTTLEDKHERSIFSVDWSPSGAIATGSGDNAIRIFAAHEAVSVIGPQSELAEEEGAAVVPEHGDSQGACVVDRDPCARGRPSEWGLSEVTVREDAHGGDVNCVRWHPTDPNLLASAGDDGTVRLWRLTVALR